MTQITRTGSGDSAVIKSDDTIVTPDDSGDCTLAVATYYIPLGGTSDALIESVHLRWNAALAATITIETCNFPRFKNGAGSGTDDVKYTDSTAGNWIPEAPTTAYVAVVGSGNSSSNLSTTAGGSAAGGCTMHLGNLGTRRGRIKVVVSTGGKLRCSLHGKD